MYSGAQFLGIASLICAGLFLVGLRFARRTTPPHLPFKFAEGLVDPAQKLRRSRRAGRLFMIVAPLAWIFFAAMAFGLLGPVENMRPIHLDGR